MTSARRPSKLSIYVGLLRPTTLLSGLSSVMVAVFYALYVGSGLSWYKVALLVGIAVLAQIASNVVNDLIDYKKGGDTEVRKGPLRPLSKGLISQRAVQWVLAIVLALLLMVAALLISSSSAWLWVIGAAVLLGLYAYSGGPFPLSRNGLGEVSVLVFFGWVPTLTSFYILGGDYWDSNIWLLATSIGLASANILLVNNYRDYEEDKACDKRTLCVRFGRDFAPVLYLSLGLLSIGLLAPMYSALGSLLIIPYLLSFVRAYRSLKTFEGAKLNTTLKYTAQNVVYLALTIGLMLLLKNVEL